MATVFDFEKLIASGSPPPLPNQRGQKPRYDFAVGQLDPESFPSSHLHEATKYAMENHAWDMVTYPHVQGLPALRDLITNKLRRDRGMDIDPSQVVITPGSGQVLALIIRLFTNPGDTLITEEYTYTAVLDYMRRSGADVLGVPMDDDGLIPDALEQTIKDAVARGKPPKFIYTIPTFQNPVGTDMSSTRRQAIMDVAAKHGVPIFEDDCYADLRFDGEPSPSIFSMDDSDMVLYSGSFSKILGPGMRLAWMVLPPTLVPRINALQVGTPPSQFAALASLYYLREHMDEHIADLSRTLKSKRDTMLSAIGESMGSSVTSTNPAGAMYLWVHLPEGTDTTPALTKALDRGVAYRTGPAHSPSGVGSNYLRLCFGHNTDQEIREGISLLADVFTEEGLLG